MQKGRNVAMVQFLEEIVEKGLANAKSSNTPRFGRESFDWLAKLREVQNAPRVSEIRKNHEGKIDKWHYKKDQQIKGLALAGGYIEVQSGGRNPRPHKYQITPAAQPGGEQWKNNFTVEDLIWQAEASNGYGPRGAPRKQDFEMLPHIMVRRLIEYCPMSDVLAARNEEEGFDFSIADSDPEEGTSVPSAAELPVLPEVTPKQTRLLGADVGSAPNGLLARNGLAPNGLLGAQRKNTFKL